MEGEGHGPEGLAAPSLARARRCRAAPGAAHLVVEDNLLVDARSGREFIPRGVNWSSFEYACAQGWGMSTLDTLVAVDARSHEADAIARWGANTVRLPLNQDCWLGTRGAPLSDQSDDRTAAGYRAGVRDFIEALNRAGLVVIIDLHSRKRIGEPEFGNVAMPDSESLAFWRSVGEEFCDNPSVMFDAFNEPYSRYDDRLQRWVFELSWECWRDGGCEAPLADDRTTTVGSRRTSSRAWSRWSRPSGTPVPDSRCCAALDDHTAALGRRSSGEYPLARQLLITTTTQALERREVNSFLQFYLRQVQRAANEQRLVALPDETVATQQRWLTGEESPVLVSPGTSSESPSTPSPTNKPAP